LECGEDDEARLATLLSEEERARASRFLFRPHRAAYVMAHARMRSILGAYLDRSPTAISLVLDPWGKPQVSDPNPGAPIQFNLGHCERLALLAVSRNIAVGVDIEELVPIEPAAAWETAQAHFSPREQTDLAWLRREAPGDSWIAGFYRCWTRKEAIAKGEGAGLRIALDAFDVTLLPEAPARLLGSRPAANLRPGWELYDLTPAPEVAAALAARPQPARIACFSLAI
jgi:4'-phosphopantetheinyl transferase